MSAKFASVLAAVVLTVSAVATCVAGISQSTTVHASDGVSPAVAISLGDTGWQ